MAANSRPTVLEVVHSSRSAGPGGTEQVLVDSGETFILTRALLGDGTRHRRLLGRAHAAVIEGDRDDALTDLAALRRVAPALPVVILAAGHAGWAEEALAAGAQDVLGRHELDAALLARSLRYAIQRQRAEHSARALHEARLQQDEGARMERALMPVPVLRTPGLRWGAAYQAGGARRLLGGDFFDLVEQRDGRLRVLIGDVCGHGPDEAALGAALRVAWRSLVLAEADEDATLAAVDAVLRAEHHEAEETFATVCDLTISADRRALTARQAGHPPPVVIDPPLGPLWAFPVAPPLGHDRDGSKVPARRWELPERWTLLLCTDGLFEVRSNGEMLGLDGLAELMSKSPPGLDTDLDEWAAEVVRTVDGLSPKPLLDDLALLVVMHGGSADTVPGEP